MEIKGRERSKLIYIRLDCKRDLIEEEGREVDTKEQCIPFLSRSAHSLLR